MNCDKLELYLADWLEDSLDATARAELEAHLAACPACRAEADAYRRQDQHLAQFYRREIESAMAAPGPELPTPVPASRRAVNWMRWGSLAAALMVAVLAGGGWWAVRRTLPKGEAILAKVKTADGSVQMMEKGQFVRVAAGAPLHQAQRVKVPAQGYLALELNDGNIIEARGGTQLTLNDFADRLEVATHRGQLWAHLNTTKPAKRFVIRTPHLSATAKGTVYGVDEGLDRSLVMVAEGTVEVEAGARQATLAEGETFSSREETAPGSLADAVGWSHYGEDLASLADDGSQTAAAAPAGQLTVQSWGAAATAVADAPTTAAQPLDNLLDLLPDTCGFFVEVRDLPGILSEFNSSDYSRFLREPSIQSWWQTIQQRPDLEDMRRVLRLAEFFKLSSLIDGQVVFGLIRDGFLLMADCRNHEQEMESQVQSLVWTMIKQGKDPIPPLDPADPDYKEYVEARRHIHVTHGRLIIGARTDSIAEAERRLVSGEAGGFREGEFYRKLTDSVTNPRLMAAADLNKFVQKINQENPHDAQVLDMFGVSGLDYLLISPSFEGRGMNQAARIGFTRDRYGVMGWLAEPAPMRGLEFFSPDVNFFASAVTVTPHTMMFDWLRALETLNPSEHAQLSEFYAGTRGFIDALGREVAVGIDNPILPVPNIKIAIEVVDRPAAETGLHDLVGRIIAELEAKGQFSYREVTQYKGHTIHSIVVDGVPLVPSYAFVDDYVVFGPGPEFVRDSIETHESGRSIATDSRLLGLLPNAGQTDFSVLVYQDVAKTMPELLRSKLAPHMDSQLKEAVPDVNFLERYRAPGIAYAYAKPNYIDLYLETPTGIDFNMSMTVPLVAKWLLPHTNVTQRIDQYAQAIDALGQLKAAAETYKAQNGRYPASLGELADPRYIERIPLDPFDATGQQTLRLIPGKEAGTIILYSVGPDLFDDQAGFPYDPEKDIDGTGDIYIEVPEPPAEADDAATTGTGTATAVAQ